MRRLSVLTYILQVRQLPLHGGNILDVDDMVAVQIGNLQRFRVIKIEQYAASYVRKFGERTLQIGRVIDVKLPVEIDVADGVFRQFGLKDGGKVSAQGVACGVLGAITGSTHIACMVMAKVAVPQMEKNNYVIHRIGNNVINIIRLINK